MLWDFGVEPSIGRWVFTLPGIRRWPTLWEWVETTK
jgi:hypothetical protein